MAVAVLPSQDRVDGVPNYFVRGNHILGWLVLHLFTLHEDVG